MHFFFERRKKLFSAAISMMPSIAEGHHHCGE